MKTNQEILDSKKIIVQSQGDDGGIGIMECTEKMCKMTIPQLMEFVKLYDEDIENHDIGYKVDRVADNLIIPNGAEFVWLSWE